MSKNLGIVKPETYEGLIDFKRFVESYYSRGKQINFVNLKNIWRYDHQLKGFLDIYTQCLTNAVKNNIPTVLDLGAGECKYSFAFKEKGINYLGVDFCKGDSQWNFSNLDVIANITVLPFRSQCIQTVMLSAVLEHINEPNELLREIYRVLTENGKLFGIVTFVCEEHQQPHDYFRYTNYGIAHLLQSAGFKNVEINYGNSDMATFAYFARRFLNMYTKNRFIRKALNLFFEWVVSRRVADTTAEYTFPLFYTFTAKK